MVYTVMNISIWQTCALHTKLKDSVIAYQNIQDTYNTCIGVSNKNDITPKMLYPNAVELGIFYQNNDQILC